MRPTGEPVGLFALWRPAAGNWPVLIDGFAVPAGTTTFNYVDVFVNAAFGSVSVRDANALRPAGSLWTVPGTVIANVAPASGRVLLGNVLRPGSAGVGWEGVIWVSPSVGEIGIASVSIGTVSNGGLEVII